jgi:hypothetical protein
MVKVLSRSLRVIDDGTGQEREDKATYEEFENEDAIILLGDPGMGKTTFFRHAAKSNYTTVRNFLIDPDIKGSDPLFLDALDEYRTIASGQDASSEVAKALCALKKPKFRLSCRAADWFGSTDQEVLRVASASGRVVVLGLCPLSRDEILKAVQGLVQDPVAFLDEADAAGLENLLGNPQTLELLARAWGSGKRPHNKFEAYQIGVSELIKEINPQHVVRGVTSPDSDNLRKAAGAAASILLLSNSVGISRTEPAGAIGYVKLAVVPHPERSDIDFMLNRRLFESPEVDRFHLIHRTIAEFLAAEDLSNRIMNGLPIDRVMALICGVDGRPVSSLRGLFAWLMCRLGSIAEGYVDRDPYGVVTYGDASVLPPSVQREIWVSLSQLRDPWFLTSEDDRDSFRELANPNTVDILQKLLEDAASGVHLKIAVLEAIANSTDTMELSAMLKSMVLKKHDNTWLRSTALKAYAQSIRNDSAQLEALDDELSRTADDPAAPEIRVDLLLLTQSFGSLGLRILSILEQAASSVRKEDRAIGRFYPLIGLPSDSDLDVILDGTNRVKTEDGLRFELPNLFEDWLKRRLESSVPIAPIRLADWLRNLPVRRNQYSEKTLASLKARFEQEPTLFEEVFNHLSSIVPNEERSFWLFIVHDLWEMLPSEVWPIPQCEFFLKHAEKEKDLERAADFFRMYLSWFPTKGASVALAEAGLDLMERRRNVARVLGNWKSCKIQKWQKDRWRENEKERRKKLANRKQNVANLTPRLTTIREGGEERTLAWAAGIYLGLFYDVSNIEGARDRLVSLTNDEIAGALINGFLRYAEGPNIPTKEAIIESWLENSIPYTHDLLSLSVFLRHSAGMNIPEEALPNCIAAVATSLGFGDKVPGYDKTLSAWMIQEIYQNPIIMKSVLREMWILGAEKNKELAGFYKVSQDPRSQRFITSLSAEVLKSGVNENHDIVHTLLSVLLFHDQQCALSIGETELDRKELSTKVRAIWSTALFVIDPSKYLDHWRTLMSEEGAALWSAIGLIRGARHEKRGAVILTTAQRAEIVAVIGKRFPNVGHPSGGWSGSQKPWDASEFIANQIRLIAADCSAEAGIQLERLGNDGSLASYHDLIKHHRAQYEKQQCESTFTFASPEQVAEAISNRAPATPSDLLVFIVDHLGALSRELARTQTERYRAYWNESGRNLIKPKREEVCSGLLAEDLQNRVRTHGLIVTVEHHMVADKECDLMVLQGAERLLPVEVKHHYNPGLWAAWRTQLDHLYTRDAKAGGLGIYLVLWSGETKGRMMPRIPSDLKRPSNAKELRTALESLIPKEDQHRLRIVIVDISKP